VADMPIEFDTFVPKGKSEVVKVVKINGKFRGYGPQAIHDILTQSDADKKKMLEWAVAGLKDRAQESIQKKKEQLIQMQSEIAELEAL
jgi:hypothetical protein